MKTRIIRIGNSQGVRIPKPLLEESGIGEEVHLNAERGRIEMASHNDDALLDPEAPQGSAGGEPRF